MKGMVFHCKVGVIQFPHRLCKRLTLGLHHVTMAKISGVGVGVEGQACRGGRVEMGGS